VQPNSTWFPCFDHIKVFSGTVCPPQQYQPCVVKFGSGVTCSVCFFQLSWRDFTTEALLSYSIPHTTNPEPSVVYPSQAVPSHVETQANILAQAAYTHHRQTGLLPTARKSLHCGKAPTRCVYSILMHPIKLNASGGSSTWIPFGITTSVGTLYDDNHPT